MPEVKLDIRAATLVVAANGSLHKNMADYVCDGVADNVEIQAAIDAVEALGGGRVVLLEGIYNITSTITITESIILEGQGISFFNVNQNTVINNQNVAGADAIQLCPAGGHDKSPAVLNMKILGSAASGIGILCNEVGPFRLENLIVNDHGSAGIKIVSCWIGLIRGCEVRFNNSRGIWITKNVADETSTDIAIENCHVGDNEAVASGIEIERANVRIGPGNWFENAGNQGVIPFIKITANAFNEVTIVENFLNGQNNVGANAIDCLGASDLNISGNFFNGVNLALKAINITGASRGVIQGNRIRSYTGDAIYLAAGHYLSIIDNVISSVTGVGIYIGDSDYITIANNVVESPGGNGIYLVGGGTSYCTVTGNTIKNAGDNGIILDTTWVPTGNIVTGNSVYNSATANIVLSGINTVYNNMGVSSIQESMFLLMKNTSGGDLVAGDVVVLKAIAAGNEITTTTTAGDQLVFGMVAEGIANNAFGYVQVKGKTVSLKVNGTTDIAIGDLIGTFTTAKIGMKAASGKMAFAVALEAYAADDSNGVIDALIITPRQAV